MTTALANAEKRVRDVHSQLDVLAERRAKIAAQVDEARTLEARLLKRSSDLDELAGVRNKIAAGVDLLDALDRQTVALEAERDGAEADLERETGLEALGNAGDATGGAQDAVLDEIGAFIKLIREPLGRLIAKHGTLIDARGVYDQIGAALLGSAWATEPGTRPSAQRLEVEGLLRRRGYSLKAADPEAPKRPSDADAAEAAIWSVYGTVRQEAWARAEIAKQTARREAEQEKQRQREERERGFEIVRIAFPRANEMILEALPGHLTDRRSHRGPDREMVLTVELERRYLSETLAALKRDLSPDNYALIAVDDDGARPVPTPLAPPSDLKKRQAMRSRDPRALTRP